jgi:hypothetical protein
VSNFSAISWGEQVTFSVEQFFSYIMGRTSYFFRWAIFQLYHGENKLLFQVSNF